jgi:hypothetical protein
MDAAAFENQIKRSMIINQMQERIRAGIEISQDELNRYLEIRPDLKTTVDY